MHFPKTLCSNNVMSAKKTTPLKIYISLFCSDFNLKKNKKQNKS